MNTNLFDKAFRVIFVLVFMLGMAGVPSQPVRAEEHDPSMTVYLTAGYPVVNGLNWPLESEIHLTIEDPATEESPDYSASRQPYRCWWSAEQGCVDFSTMDFPYAVGQVFTMSDGTTERIFVITSLALKITSIDVDADIVHGMAEAGSHVNIWIGYTVSDAKRYEMADLSGVWNANFAVAGDEPGEESTFNIVPG
ncbi:MAG: hypothetical protein MUC85_10255, partial [Anaerolineales bacterium]|nr:hypothetical protein [Anaerolineales bacterium]